MEVVSSCRNEVLFLRRQGQYCLLSQFPKVADAASETTGCSVEHGCGQCSGVVGGDQIAQRPGTIEFTPTHRRAEVRQMVKAIEQQPWAEPLFLKHQFAGLRQSAPDPGPSVTLRPYRYNSRSRVPAP